MKPDRLIKFGRFNSIVENIDIILKNRTQSTTIVTYRANLKYISFF